MKKKNYRQLSWNFLLHPQSAFFVALLFHTALVFFIGHYRHPELWENGTIANSLLAGEGFTISFSLPLEPTSWQSPGYPYLLNALWHVFGQNPSAYLWLSLLQALAISSTVFPMGALARRWFNRDAGVLAQWIACFMPLFAWYATRMHQTALVMSIYPWLLYGWLSLLDSPKLSKSILTGVGTGLAGLFQPVLLALFGMISAVKLLNTLRHRQLRQAGIVFATGLLTLIVLIPWTVRNYQAHGRLVLIKDSFGKEFWMGNNPHATCTAYAEGGEVEITNAYPPKAYALRGTAKEIEVMSAMQKEAWDYCKADPAAFLKRCVTKVVWFWTIVPERYARRVHGGEAVTFRLVLTTYWFSLVALAAVSAVTFRPWSREYGRILLLFFVFYSILYCLTHVGLARYRGEMEFILVPAVSAGLLWIGRKFRLAPFISKKLGL